MEKAYKIMSGVSALIIITLAVLGITTITNAANGVTSFKQTAIDSGDENGIDSKTGETNKAGKGNDVAMKEDDKPVISYYDANEQKIMLAICQTKDCADTNKVIGINYQTIDTVGSTVSYTSVGIGSTGYPVVAYDDPDTKEVKLAICTDSACTGKTIETVGSYADSGLSNAYPVVTSGFDNEPSFVAYQNNGIVVKLCVNNDCDNSASIIIEEDDSAMYPSVALRFNAGPAISYQVENEEGKKELRLTLCEQSGCGGDAYETTVIDDTAEGNGFYSDIAVKDTSTSFPTMAYYNKKGDDSFVLRVAKCKDETCSQISRKTLAKSTNAEDLGIAVGKNGKAVVSFSKSNSDGVVMLKEAKCKTKSCGKRTIKNVDVTPISGKHNSIAISTDGKPVISYTQSFDSMYSLYVAKARKK